MTAQLLTRLTELEKEIAYRKDQLDRLVCDYRIYQMEKDILDSKQREYDFLRSQRSDGE